MRISIKPIARKMVLAVVLVASLLGAAGASLAAADSEARPAYAADAWRQSGGRWWYQAGDSYAVGWKRIGKDWHYFDSAGWMRTGWLSRGGSWYYLEPSGRMATGWESVSGDWYYFNRYGVMQTGWQFVDGKWYYLESSGKMATGWKSVDGKWYYLRPSGAMANDSWIDGGKIYDHGFVFDAYYYVGSDGAMRINQWVGTYYVNQFGICIYNKLLEQSARDFLRIPDRDDIRCSMSMPVEESGILDPRTGRLAWYSLVTFETSDADGRAVVGLDETGGSPRHAGAVGSLNTY